MKLIQIITLHYITALRMPSSFISQLLQQTCLQSLQFYRDLLYFIDMSLCAILAGLLAIMEGPCELVYLIVMEMDLMGDFIVSLRYGIDMRFYIVDSVQLVLEEVILVGLFLVLLVLTFCVLLQQPYYLTKTHHLHLYTFHPRLQSQQSPGEEVVYLPIHFLSLLYSFLHIIMKAHLMITNTPSIQQLMQSRWLASIDLSFLVIPNGLILWPALLLQNFTIPFQKMMNYIPPPRNSVSSTTSSDRAFKENPAENNDPFLEPSYNHPSNLKYNPLKSKPISKPSVNATIDTPPQVNRNISSIRNSCFVGTPTTWEGEERKVNRSMHEGQDIPFLPLSINNSCRFVQNAPLDQFSEERRKSESSYNKNYSPLQANFLKSNGEAIGIPTKQKDGTIVNEGGLRDMIEQLNRRVANTEQQISKIKQRDKEDKRNSHADGDLKQFKGKLLQLAKFNSKHFTEYEGRLEKQQKMMQEMQARVLNFNGSDYLKRANILEAKLNELYEGFKIKADHNQREISLGLEAVQRKIKDYIQGQINIIRQKIHEGWEDSCLSTRIHKIQVEMKQRTWYNINQLQKSTKRSLNWKAIQSRQIVVIKNDHPKEKQKSKFSNSPRNWVYQTPTKENIDTPIKGLNFQEQIHSEVMMREQIYYVDLEGYLLDENKCYLLNSQNQQILLPPSILACLRENDMLRA